MSPLKYLRPYRRSWSLKRSFLLCSVIGGVTCSTFILYLGTLTAFFHTARDSFFTWSHPFVLDEYPKLICHGFTGRLGNEMFQYASIIGLALATNRTPVLMGSTVLDKVLETPTRHPNKQKWLEARCSQAAEKRYYEHSCCTFNEMLFDLDPTSDCHVDLYLMSWKYFRDYEEEIRKALTFKESVRKEAAEMVSGLRQLFRGSTFIGIHVRKGDLINEYNTQLGYPTVTAHFFERTVEYFENLYPNAVFIVASDSVVWCRINFPKGHKALVLNNHDPAVDLTILASLDHVAITFGSYSWWAGYLNWGKVVYINALITGVPNSPIGRTFGRNGSDFVYPTWIPI